MFVLHKNQIDPSITINQMPNGVRSKCCQWSLAISESMGLTLLLSDQVKILICAKNTKHKTNWFSAPVASY